MDTVKQACLETAKRFIKVAEESPNPELMRLCAEGLKDFSDNYENYSALVSVCADFLKELSEKVKEVAEKEKKDSELHYDDAFCLMEDMAVIMRETCLRRGAASDRKIQEDILKYFEGSGLWEPYERTLISDFYYYRIPIAVLHQAKNV